MANLIFQYHAENSLESNQEHGLCSSWARTFVTNPKRAGSYSLRVEQRGNVSNDQFPCGALGNNTKHRNETRMRNSSGEPVFIQGTEYWIGFSTLFQSDWPNRSDRAITWQLIQGGAGPHVHGQTFGNSWEIVRTWSGGSQKQTLALIRDQWLDIVMRFRISTGSDGLFEMWQNGSKVVSMTGPVGYSGENPYFKFGSYWGSDHRGSITYVNFFDAIRIAQGTNGFDLVNPAAYDSGELPPSVVATPTITPADGTYPDPLSVTMACETPDSNIRYTIDGSQPTTSSTLYGGAFQLNEGAYTVRARAFASGLTASEIASRNYTVATSSGSVEGLEYFLDNLTGSGALSGHSADTAANGSWQNAGNYTLTGTGLVRPNGTAQDLAYHSVTPPSADYENRCTGTVGTSGGNRRIDCGVRGTVDVTGNVGYWGRFMGGNLNLRRRSGGSESTLNTVSVSGYSETKLYTVATAVKTNGGNVELTGRVIDNGVVVATTTHTDSSTAKILDANHPFFMLKMENTTNGGLDAMSAELLQPLGVVANPVIDPASGSYSAPLQVTITSATAGAAIYYTTDGSDPTTASTLYTAPFEPASSVTVKARAYRDWYTPSQIVTRTYEVTQAKAATPTISPTDGTYPAALTVTMECATAGVTIRYVTDGSVVTSSATAYTAPFDLPAGSYIVRARAYKDGMLTSSVAERTYTVNAATVATPVIAPASGSYTAPLAVTITCDTSAAEIRYTLNGVDPTASSTLYTGAFEPGIGTDIVVKARAFKANMTDSLVASQTYTVTQAQVAIPTIDPGNGTYPAPLTVTLACATEAAEIRYTLDGTTPTQTSDLYAGPFQLGPGSYTVVVRGFKDGMLPSNTRTRTHTVEETTVATPVIFPASGTYEAPLSVQITCTTLGAAIRYTTDDSEPTAISTLYTAAIVLGSGSHTVKAKGFLDGLSDSLTASVSYTVTVGSGTQDVVIDNFAESSAVSLNSHAPDTGGVWDAQSSNYTVGANTGTVKPPTGSGAYLALNNATIGTSQKVRLTGGVGSVQTNRRLEVWTYADLPSGNHHGYQVRGWPAQNSFRITRINNGSAQLLGSTSFTFSDATAYTVENETTLNGSNDPVIVATLFDGETPVATITRTDDDQTNKITTAGQTGFLLLGDNAYATSFTAIDLDLSATLGTVADPVFTPAAGTYDNQVSVAIACATDQATIHYTTDGTDPTTASAVYSTALDITTTTTVKALAVRTDYTDSQVTSAAYTINVVETVSTPTVTPNGGTFTDPVEVTLATVTEGATLYYTDDGTTPTATSTAYTVPFTLTESAILKVIGIKAGSYDSLVATATFNVQLGTVDTPTFSPAAGGYDNQVTVSIACATANAVIHYTRDGSTPTAASPTYSAPFEITATETVKAIGVLAPYGNSPVASATYTITVVPTVADPTITPNGGTFTEATEVTLACVTEDADLYYTIDGTTPDATKTLYSAPVTFEEGVILKVIATKAGSYDSQVVSAAFDINIVELGTVEIPTITPNGGTFTDPVEVSLSCPTVDNTIHYTRDGTTPTTGSPTYSAPFTISANETVNAFAVAAGFNDSAVATADFVIETLTAVADPEISPNGGTFAGAGQEVTLTCATEDAEIYYRTDGGDIIGDADNGDILYTGPFILDRVTTLTVQAFKPGLAASGVVSADFTLKPTPPVITGFETTPKSVIIQFDQAIFPAGPGSYRITVNNQVRNDTNSTLSPVTVTVLYSNYEYSITMEALSTDGTLSDASNEITATTAKSPIQVKAEDLTGFD